MLNVKKIFEPPFAISTKPYHESNSQKNPIFESHDTCAFAFWYKILKSFNAFLNNFILSRSSLV